LIYHIDIYVSAISCTEKLKIPHTKWIELDSRMNRVDLLY